MLMETLSTREIGLDAVLRRLDRRYEPTVGLVDKVRAILDAVRCGGDNALMQFAKEFDGATFTVAQLSVSQDEKVHALRCLEPDVRAALKEAISNVTTFARAGKRKSWRMKNSHGAVVGERFDPMRRVGIYVPAGSAPLVSTAVMTIAIAKAAGVPEIVAVSPVKGNGQMDPVLLGAMVLCGATEIFRIGGAHSVGALAYGTATIRAVDKICGPGSAWVTEAKRQVVGRTAIDLLPGPSEVAVVTDAKANPRWAAADLLAQAEHGPDSAILLISTSARQLNAVRTEVTKQAVALKRGAILEKVLDKNALFVLASNEAEAVLLVNAFSPEHLALHVENHTSMARQIKTAGAIFLGGWSPVVVGDFVAGPSHTLPTGGAAKSFGGLTVEMFQRRTSLVQYDKKSLAKADAAIQIFSQIEGLDAHGKSSAVRFQNTKLARRSVKD